MADRNALSGQVISQIALMQSVVAQLPDSEAVLAFACSGLRDVSGVADVRCTAYAETTPPLPRTQPTPDEQLFAIRKNGFTHANIVFTVSDNEQFSPYRPYIENFCAMLGVILEERRQQSINQTLMRELEQRVIERTAQLQSKVQEHKAAQEAAASEKERLLVTLRSIGDGVIATDTAGRVVLMNKVAEALTGWESDLGVGKPLEHVFSIIDEISGEPRDNPVTKVLATGEVVELANPTVLISRGGDRRIIADCGSPIRDSSGSIIGVVLVFRDMTEKQAMLDAMQRTAKLESLGVLAGGIAHDFNNLLGALFGYIDMAAEKAEVPEVRRYLATAMTALDRARGLTRQLLTFAKGGAPIKEVDYLFPFVQKTAQFALSGSNVSCAVEVQPGLWPCDFDKNQIGQVIDNLVINAQQAMPNGGTITISACNSPGNAAAHPGLPPGNYVHLAIADQGIGIPKEILPRIFDPFFTTKKRGHGLGLATAFSIVSRHDGILEAESANAKGSTFHLYLPAAATDKPQIPESQSRVTYQGAGTFVVLDDEELILGMLEAILVSMGYTVVCKTNGQDALDYFESAMRSGKSIAGMIFDLTIPGGLGGRDIIDNVRKTSTAIPVFVASGYADDPVIAQPTKFGFTASICKPFRKAEIAQMLSTYLKS